MNRESDYAGWERRWPRVVVDCDTAKALKLIRDYYSVRPNSTPRYSGSQFEVVAARNANPNTIGADEFLAVSLLSVPVKGHAALRILSEADEITGLLVQIPDIDLVDADSEILKSGTAPASRLWKLLRSGKDGIGKTTTSKLMAAKRPRLIPIWDSFIEHATGLDTIDYWRQFQIVLRANDKRIWNWLNEIRREIPEPLTGLSTLRILDVILWMLVDSDAL